MSTSSYPWYRRPAFHFALSVLAAVVLLGFAAQLDAPSPADALAPPTTFAERVLTNFLTTVCGFAMLTPVTTLLFGSSRPQPAYLRLHRRIADRVPVFGYLYPRRWMALDYSGLVGAFLGAVLFVWCVAGYFVLAMVVAGDGAAAAYAIGAGGLVTAFLCVVTAIRILIVMSRREQASHE